MQELYIVVINSVFWEELLCSLVEICLRFGEMFCIHLQGSKQAAHFYYCWIGSFFNDDGVNTFI